MRSSVISLVMLVGLAGLPACEGIPDAVYPTTQPDDPSGGTTALGIGDVFELTIYNGSKETKATYTVDPVGEISVQYIGAVKVVDKKPVDLQVEIKERLSDGYLVDPIVSVRVTEINSRQLSISGEVAKDGKIKFTPGMTIIDAIAQSGGFTPMAKKNHVRVIRTVDGNEVTYKIPVGAIQGGSRPNFYVAAGDRVFVPERIW